MNQCKAAVFKRGASFQFTFSFPESVTPGQFAGWTVRAELRRFRHPHAEGLISAIPAVWDNTETEARVTVTQHDTEAWPLGLAEFDILLTSPTGQKVLTSTLLFDIQRGITR